MALEQERHALLSRYNHERLAPALPGADWIDKLGEEMEIRLLEGELIESERDHVAARAAQAPTDVKSFVRWFEGLERTGPGQHDPLFPWIAERATREQLRWFLRQEVAGEAGFDDLVALSQLKLADRPKLEMARNYWDEMGRGHEGGMHGPMLARLAHALHVDELDVPVVWEAVALGNVMMALAANRRYAYQAIGALGVIELTAPARAAHVNHAMKRLDVPAHDRQYYALHATLDIKHANAWIAEVIAPLVADDPTVASAIAEGALMRLSCGARCFSRYRAELQVRTLLAA